MPRASGGGGWLERHLPAVFMGPSLVVLIVMIVGPIAYTIYLSFTSWTGGRLIAPRFVGLENFSDLILRDARFHAALWHTFLFAALAVILETVLGVAIAVLLHRKFAGRTFVRSVFMLPMIATPVAIALVWQLMFQPQLGLLNALLHAVGLPQWTWTSNATAALPLLAIVDAWEWTPFITLMTLAALASLPSWPSEAAEIDGATAWQKFRYVTFPLIRPVILAAAAFRSIDALKTFDLILVVTGGGPGFASETLDVYAYRTTFEYQRLGYAAAMLLIFFLIIILLTVLLLRFRREGDR